MAKTKTYIFELPENVDGVMNTLATEMNVSMAEVVRRGVALLSYVRRQTKDGSQLCIVDGDEVVIQIDLDKT